MPTALNQIRIEINALQHYLTYKTTQIKLPFFYLSIFKEQTSVECSRLYVNLDNEKAGIIAQHKEKSS